VIQPKSDEPQIDRIFTGATVAEKFAPSQSQVEESLLESAELVLLRQFFDLLAEWNESQEGETKG
jgi:hypothetical protein